MKLLFCLVSFLAVSALLIWCTLCVKDKEIPAEENKVTFKFSEKAKIYKLLIAKPVKINESSLIIELIETKVDDFTCKMSIRDVDTDESVIFCASQNQLIKGIEKFFGPRGLGVTKIERDSVTIEIRYGEMYVEKNGVLLDYTSGNKITGTEAGTEN